MPTRQHSGFARRAAIEIKARIRCTLFESSIQHALMEFLIPAVSRLFHPWDAMQDKPGYSFARRIRCVHDVLLRAIELSM